MAQWTTQRTFVHTFSTGRSAELREAISLSELVRSGRYTDAVDQLSRWVGGLTPPDDAPPVAVLTEGQDIVVEAMLVAPRVARDPAGADGVLPISVLEESEIGEIVLLAFGGRERFEAFRRARADARADREADGDATVDAPARKPRGSARRPSRARGAA